MMTIREKIQSMVDFCNLKTGKNDADLTTAVKSLGDGFGKGSSAPTEFTNLIKSNDVILYINQVLSTSTAGEFVSKDGCFVVELPLKNWGNTNPAFRLRGIGFYNSYVNYSTDGITWKFAYFTHSKSLVVDEYGDRLYGTTASFPIMAYRFNLSVVPSTEGLAIGSVDEVRNSNFIVTANEPIGNIGTV